MQKVLAGAFLSDAAVTLPSPWVFDLSTTRMGAGSGGLGRPNPSIPELGGVLADPSPLCTESASALSAQGSRTQGL